MNTLELINEETNEVFLIERNNYGIVFEKYHKLAPAIGNGWSLVIKTRLGETVLRSEFCEV